MKSISVATVNTMTGMAFAGTHIAGIGVLTAFTVLNVSIGS